VTYFDETALILPVNDLRRISEPLRQELIALLIGPPKTVETPVAPQVPATNQTTTPNLADFSESEMAEFLGGCGDKTRQALQAVAQQGGRTFRIDTVANALGISPGKLGGIWSGVTRRTRNLKKLPNVEFAGQVWDAKQNCYVGTMSETTFNSLQKALGLPTH
jgi:hypothetical protein